jgi:hypothetical protein
VQEFANTVVIDRMRYEPPGGGSNDDVCRIVAEGALAGKLEDVLSTALDFAQTLAGERAGFSLETPALEKLGFIKTADDPSMTNLGHVGVDPAEEDELVGEVRFCVSPMLVKWGSGSGENLQQANVLMKAFVEMVDQD